MSQLLSDGKLHDRLELKQRADVLRFWFFLSYREALAPFIFTLYFNSVENAKILRRVSGPMVRETEPKGACPGSSNQPKRLIGSN